MTILQIHQVQPGMTLASPVLDSRGLPLLPQGATLSEALIASLERRGIAVLEIAEPPSETDKFGSGDAAGTETRRSAAQQRVAHLFRRARCNAIGENLYRTVLEYRLDKLR